MIVYLDFDGTVVEHQYPLMGRCNFGCFEVIKKLQDAGHKIILNTYRADCKNGTLEKALYLINEQYWMLLVDRDLEKNFKLLPITEFTKNKIHPHPFNWNDIKEKKILFIDDIAYNMPLKKTVGIEGGNMVDWEELNKEFEKEGLYEKT